MIVAVTSSFETRPKKAAPQDEDGGCCFLIVRSAPFARVSNHEVKVVLE